MSLYKCTVSILLFSLYINVLQAQITKSPLPYVEYLLTPSNQDWNYKIGENAILNLQAYAGGIPLNNVEVTVEAGDEMMPVEIKSTANIENGKATINIGTMNRPGFRTCVVNFQVENKLYTKQIKVGFSPQDIEPIVKMPKDFLGFWKESMAKAAKIPAISETVFMPDLSTKDVDVFLVKLQCYEKNNFIYGYLSKPKKEGKYPVLMVPPGAGVKRIDPIMDYAEHGFITLAIEIHGLSPLLDNEAVSAKIESLSDYLYYGIENPENYYYRKVYMGCIRAIDYLCSLPEFDGKNVGVCGGSQGGALSIVTAALDNRVKFVTSFYPALCEMGGLLHGRVGGWPKYFKSPKFTTDTDTVINTLSYYDVVNFSRLLKVPGFYSYGYNDNTCPPTSVCSALNCIQSPKEVVVTPTSAYWRFPETNNQSIEWMKKQCGK